MFLVMDRVMLRVMLPFALLAHTMRSSMGFCAEIPIERKALLEGLELPEQRAFKTSSRIGPCEDFFAHACTHEIESFRMPKDRSEYHFAFTDAEIRILHAKKKFLALLAARDGRSLSPRKRMLRSHYLACMDRAANARDERSEVDAEKATILGRDRAEFANLLADRNLLRKQPIVLLSDLTNVDDPAWLDAIFEADMMSLPDRDYYFDPELISDYRRLIASFFEAIGLDRPWKRAADVLAVETAFAGAVPPSDELRRRTSGRKVLDRARFASDYKVLGIHRILEQLPQRTLVREYASESLNFAVSALRSWDLEALKNYVLHRNLSHLLDDAYPAYLEAALDFERKHFGAPISRQDRKARCTDKVNEDLNMELDAELLPILFPDFHGREVETMAGQVRQALVRRIKANAWLSVGAKAEALKKVETATLMIGMPKTAGEWDLINTSELKEELKEGQPFANDDLLRELWNRKNIERFAKARDRRRWLMGPLEINAYYTPDDNTFVLPIGVLQAPIYEESASLAANLGSVGAIIGHELGHAIDDQGSSYDSGGRIRDWMTAADRKEFERRSHPFVERFDSIGYNGAFTIGENIGDHVGVAAALDALQASKDPQSELAMRGFFLQYARSYCYKASEGAKELARTTDSHALGEARVNEQVIHDARFYEAFSCKKGDRMYLEPAKRIQFW